MAYVVYIIISRSEYQCMIRLNSNINNICRVAVDKIKHKGGSFDGYNNSYDNNNYEGERFSNVNMVADNMRKGFGVYKNIWKKMLFYLKNKFLKIKFYQFLINNLFFTFLKI